MATQRDFRRLKQEITYSPTELAKSGLVPWLQRAMIYRRIQRGQIKVIHDSYGHVRITLEEIERLTKERHEEEEQAATETELKEKIRKHLNKAAAYHRLATSNPHEMVVPMLNARRARLAKIVDPDGTCSPAELERRIEVQLRSEMHTLTAKKMKKRQVKEQYEATHRQA